MIILAIHQNPKLWHAMAEVAAGLAQEVVAGAEFQGRISFHVVVYVYNPFGNPGAAKRPPFFNKKNHKKNGKHF